MRLRFRFCLPLAVLAMCLPSDRAHAQQAADRHDVGEIARDVRSRANADAALQALRGDESLRTRSDRDAIADTLAVIAISHPGRDADGARVRRAAVQALVVAGSGGEVTPFAGAGQRLLRIAEEAEDVGIRGAALSGLTLLPDREQARSFLRRVAISENAVAHAAIGHLARDMGEEGLAILRQLHQARLVRERLALRTLLTLAQTYGWGRQNG